MVSLRAEKTTRNKDDLRVMVAGTMVCIFMLFIQTGYGRFYDIYVAPRPYVFASVELYHVAENLPPVILYDADANQAVKGLWIASIYTADDVRLNSRRGEGSYTNFEDGPKIWAWSAWFDNEQSDPPPIPDQPFYICVRYDVVANDSGVNDSSVPYCSELYDHDNPTNRIDDLVYEGLLP